MAASLFFRLARAVASGGPLKDKVCFDEDEIYGHSFFLGENCLWTSWGFKEIEIAFLLAKLFIASYPALYSASGMRNLGEGLRLQTQQGTDSGEGSQKQLLLTAGDAMGDRNLLNPEIGGRQVSETCFLQR